jgi:hypothetical protein
MSIVLAICVVIIIVVAVGGAICRCYKYSTGNKSHNPMLAVYYNHRFYNSL